VHGSKKHDVVMAGAALRLKMAFSSTSPSITLGAKAPCAVADAPLPPPVLPCKRGWWRSPVATAMPSPLAVEATAAEALVLATVLQL
jgi:hypothetical protein